MSVNRHTDSKLFSWAEVLEWGRSSDVSSYNLILRRFMNYVDLMSRGGRGEKGRATSAKFQSFHVEWGKGWCRNEDMWMRTSFHRNHLACVTQDNFSGGGGWRRFDKIFNLFTSSVPNISFPTKELKGWVGKGVRKNGVGYWSDNKLPS